MADYTIKISAESEIDILESYLYYEEKKNGLGARFLEKLDESFASIKQSPFSYNIKYKTLRMFLMKVFPFLIFFIVNEELKEIQVIGVLHSKRNPKLINSRIS